MTAIHIPNKDVQVLAEDELKLLTRSGESNKNFYHADETITTNSARSSSQRRFDLVMQLLDDSATANLRKRKIRMFMMTGILTLGVGLGASYLSAGSAPMSAYSRSSATKIISPPKVIQISSATKHLPASISALKFSTGFGRNQSPLIQSPAWVPSPNSSGTVTRSGDVALVDTSNSVHAVALSVEVTNRASLDSSYTNYHFPISIYQCSPSLGICGGPHNGWTSYQSEKPLSETISTTHGGFSVRLAAGRVYDLVMQSGQGRYTTTSLTSANSASLSPSFFLSTRSL